MLAPATSDYAAAMSSDQLPRDLHARIAGHWGGRATQIATPVGLVAVLAGLPLLVRALG